MTSQTNLYSFLYVFHVNNQERPLALSSKTFRLWQTLSVSTLSLWYKLAPPLAWMIALACPSLRPCFPMIYYQHSVLSNVFIMSIWSCSLPVKILQWCPIPYSKSSIPHCGLPSLLWSYSLSHSLWLHPCHSHLSPFTPAHFLEKNQAHSHMSTCSVGNHITDFSHLQQVLTQKSLHQWGIIQF